MAADESQSLECRHCLSPLTSEADRNSGYCCSGCRAAHSFISAAGLNYFYDLRARTGTGRAAADVRGNERLSFYDDPGFAEEFIVRGSNGLNSILFHAPGIHCAACVWILEKLPEILSGVVSVRVDILRSTARVIFQPEKVHVSEIADAFSKIGYRPHPIRKGAIQTSHADRAYSLRLGVAAFCAMNVMLLFVARYQGLFTGIESIYQTYFSRVSLVAATISVLYCAEPFFRAAISGLRLGRVHIDLPLSLAIAGGYGISAINTLTGRSEIYFDTVTALIFLLLVGRWFQRRALKDAAAASDLFYSLCPLSATIVEPNGEHRDVYMRTLEVGNLIVVGQDERFPADGDVVEGSGSVNLAMLTGESRPVSVESGSAVFSGAVNLGRPLTVRVTSVGEQTRLGGILRSVQENALGESAHRQFADRVSRYFVWVVLTLALLTFVVLLPQGFSIALDRLFALLIVSCPCALGIATPLALSLASARAARAGILLRDGAALERAAAVREVIFDKTGTITEGNLRLVEVRHVSGDFSSHQLWGIVASLELEVDHPVARLLRNAAAKAGCEVVPLSRRESVTGRGVEGWTCDNRRWRIGSPEWAARDSAVALQLLNTDDSLGDFGRVALSCDGVIVVLFSIGDTPRPEAQAVIAELRGLGLNTRILSGDTSRATAAIAARVGLQRGEALGGLSPEEKAGMCRASRPGVAFVGDGVNDALALTQADLGIGICGGAEICMTVSDVFLLRPDLRLVVELIRESKKTLAMLRRHLAVTVFYNATAATLAVLGYIGPLAAALIMPASSITVILSSLWGAPFSRRTL